MHRRQRQGQGDRDVPLVVDVPQASQLLGLGESTVWGLVWSHELRCARVGWRVLIPRAEVERFLAERLGAYEEQV